MKSWNEPIGIGGWLILPTLGLIATPFVILFQLYRDMLPVFEPSIWYALTDSSSNSYHPLWKTLIIFELTSNVFVAAVSISLIWLLYKRSKYFPKLFISWLILTSALQGGEILLASQISDLADHLRDESSFKNLVRSIIWSVIWTGYFLTSIRVRNTFVEPVS